MSKSSAILKQNLAFLMPNYRKGPIVVERGKGSYVWDADGKKYLDFFPGWGVSGLGHCAPRVVAAIRQQATRLLHVSNNYSTDLQAQLAKTLVQKSFKGRVFFSNSGAESTEAAIKLARRYGDQTGERYEIITMKKSFHGRTFAALSATGQPEYSKGFGPMVRGFRHVPFGDFEAVRKAVTDRTVAVMLEPVQGEGGIHVASLDYVRKLRDYCTQHKILLIFDEVQTGMGRTGKLFAFQHYGVEPDVMTLAKSLGNGVPIGAVVAATPYGEILQPGTHASTYGGSPLVCAASLAVFETIQKENLLANARKMGQYLRQGLEILQKKYPLVKEIRGLGVMLGMELDIPGAEIVESCAKQGLLINCTQQTVLRIMPSMQVNRAECDKALKILDKTLAEVKN
ncbi:MAG: aspartate aminotransferase family protein [Candidatus Omnitrophica bacterium]|nr:aspartate aminotransferase family protein [Candidatus Omnitrophota bacterium]